MKLGSTGLTLEEFILKNNWIVQRHVRCHRPIIASIWGPENCQGWDQPEQHSKTVPQKEYKKD